MKLKTGFTGSHTRRIRSRISKAGKYISSKTVTVKSYGRKQSARWRWRY